MARRRKNGKQIGDEFERVCCRYLSTYATGTDCSKLKMVELPIRRRTTAVTPSGMELKTGDIGPMSDDLYFPFAPECKRYADCELEGMFTAQRWVGWTHWDQAVRQATEGQPIPMLLFNRPRKPVYCMLPERYRVCLKIQPRNGPVLTVRPQGRANEEVTLLDILDLIVQPLPNADLRSLRALIRRSRT